MIEPAKTYEQLQLENKAMHDALEHIELTALRSRTSTRRLRWIALRARDGVDGTDIAKTIDLPRHASAGTMENMQKRIDYLERENRSLRDKLEKVPITEQIARIFR